MPKFLSLFSGCGGLDLGFLDTGFECVGAYEIDESAIALYRDNIGDHIQQLDLSCCDAGEVGKAVDVDVLIAGPPCQGFSTIGKRNFKDPRNQLILKCAEIALHLQPSVVVIENVPGIRAGSMKAYWLQTKKKLSDAGYQIHEYSYDFSEFGLAQTRKRVFIIATKLGQKIDSDSMQLLKESSKVTLGSALYRANRSTSHVYRRFEVGSRDYQIIENIGIGQKLCNVRAGSASVPTWDIPKVFGKVNLGERKVLETIRTLRRQIRRRSFGDSDPVCINDIRNSINGNSLSELKSLIAKGYVRKVDSKYYDLTGTFNGKYRRLSSKTPCMTVDTNFGNPKYFVHSRRNSGFSVREAARIQGFPDNYRFNGSMTTSFRAIGNAVPPLISTKIATQIRESIFR